jgi:hypothetical protein
VIDDFRTHSAYVCRLCAPTDDLAETGAKVLRGALRYPSDSGGWQLGDIDLSEHCWQVQSQ